MDVQEKTPICRRCGLPKDEDHVRSPYLCRFEPQRDLVEAALTGSEHSRRVLARERFERALKESSVAWIVLLCLILSPPASAQRRRAVSTTPCTAESIELAYNWRVGTFEGCTCDSEKDRCWMNRMTCEPLWNTDNLGCGKVTQWLAHGGDYVMWLVGEWSALMARGVDPGFDVPSPECTYHGFTFTVAEGSNVHGLIEIHDERDPRVIARIPIPVQVQDYGSEFGFVPWKPGVPFDASFRMGCYRDPKIVAPEGVTVERRASVEVAQ